MVCPNCESIRIEQRILLWACRRCKIIGPLELFNSEAEFYKEAKEYYIEIQRVLKIEIIKYIPGILN